MKASKAPGHRWRHVGGSVARHGAEIALLALLLLTVVVIGFQREIFGRDILISQATVGQFLYSGYADQASGGASTLEDADKPLRFTCALRPGVPNMFCGYEVAFDGYGTHPGLDLRNLNSLELEFEYSGPASTARLGLKNRDDRYSKLEDRSTNKVNKVDFSLRQGRQTLVFHSEDFSVAEWWLAGKNLPPELSRRQLDNVVGLEVSTGPTAAPGNYAFRLNSIKLRRSAITPARLYQSILVVWGAVLLLYMLNHFRRARQDTAVLQLAKAAAERASRAKSDFLASMSHELRTPLNAVLGYAQLLLRADLPAAHLEPVRTIHRSGNHLLSLITDLLDLSKIEAGKMELHPAPTDVQALVAGVGEMIGVRAEEKGLKFNCLIDDDVVSAVQADEKRLRQILLNLLSNAVKFTEEGRVSLVVSQLRRTGQSATLRFEVQDSGPGIAEHELELIFRRFEQVGAVGGHEGGTGLGLTISRQFAHLMGSNIQVHSRVGQGTSFWFEATFPLAERPATPGRLAFEQVRGYSGARRRVLVVDDNSDSRNVLRDLLTQLGFEVSIAANGVEALQQAQAASPDLILMDLKMPVLDGLQTTAMLRMMDSLKGVAILANSADSLEHAEASALGAGADAFISKPIDNSELLEAVGRLLKLEWRLENGQLGTPSSPAGVGEPMAGPAHQKTVETVAADEPLRILLAEDNPANQQLISAMLEGAGFDLTIVPNGAAALGAFEGDEFDLVLMDVRMPELNGIEATRAMRRQEQADGRSRTPIIALSADAASEFLVEYRRAGMDGHLDKPIRLEELFGLLQRVADRDFQNPAVAV
ncbi:response regulator [Caulobacter sp. DWR1-3-2b1]|uniref:response regulator n=1 Tax=Caulobacter sp. DWR1-3-2b1 TaxID=2804670 RepID=UPI003CF741F6